MPTALKTPDSTGNDDPLDAELPGDVDGVNAAIAADRDDGEIARVETALDADGADRARHRHVGDGPYAVRGVFQ